MDILLDKETNDAIFINGAAPTTYYDPEVVAQRLSVRLLTFVGEYGFDTNFGVPYWQRILGFNINKADLDYIYQREILKEEKVAEIKSFQSSISNRVYSITFSVRLVDGSFTDEITITPTT